MPRDLLIINHDTTRPSEFQYVYSLHRLPHLKRLFHADDDALAEVTRYIEDLALEQINEHLADAEQPLLTAGDLSWNLASCPVTDAHELMFITFLRHTGRTVMSC